LSAGQPICDGISQDIEISAGQCDVSSAGQKIREVRGGQSPVSVARHDCHQDMMNNDSDQPRRFGKWST